MKREPTHADVIKEFWRVVESGSEQVAVEYGSDLDTSVWGSGFPSTGVYARSGWNLNNLPKLGNSVLSHVRNISGMTIPWFYVGMLFSSFCWHTEDHYCYSINYVHTGEAKQWYGIPGRSAMDFERVWHQMFPGLFEAQPDLFFQMVTMVSPALLRRHNVPVYQTTQQAGEFVITFPQV